MPQQWDHPIISLMSLLNYPLTVSREQHYKCVWHSEIDCKAKSVFVSPCTAIPATPLSDLTYLWSFTHLIAVSLFEWSRGNAKGGCDVIEVSRPVCTHGMTSLWSSTTSQPVRVLAPGTDRCSGPTSSVSVSLVSNSNSHLLQSKLTYVSCVYRMAFSCYWLRFCVSKKELQPVLSAQYWIQLMILSAILFIEIIEFLVPFSLSVGMGFNGIWKEYLK